MKISVGKIKMFFYLSLFFLLLIFSSKHAFACISTCGSSTASCYLDECLDCNQCLQRPGEKKLGTFMGLGALSDFIASLQLNPSSPAPASNAFSNFISKAIGIMTVIAIIWFIFTLFLGAIAWISSGGDKVKLQNAQKHITNGLTGLIIVIAALFLVKLIGIIFGIDILNLTKLINDL